ncbi:MAG: hypothetical protein ACM37U_09665 [Gemmatimonas sp.]
MPLSLRDSSFLGLIFAGAIACGPSEAAKRRADSAVAAAAKAHVVTRAGEVFGARREAQAFFDSARTQFVLKDHAAAAKSLRAAAQFTRQQADSSAGLDKDALVESAEELERLATNIANGRVKFTKTVDYAIARTQLAEAQHHYSRMIAAWNRHDAGIAGAELTMSIDHFDRGVSDAGLHLETETQATLADVRTLGGEMTKGSTLNAAAVEGTLASFDSELQRVSSLVSKKK